MRRLFVILICMAQLVSVTSVLSQGTNGDIDGNGKVNIFDVLGLLNIMKGDTAAQSSLAQVPGEYEVLNCIKMVPIVGGSFQMGETGVAEPVHTVAVDVFHMSTTEITINAYLAITGNAPALIPSREQSLGYALPLGDVDYSHPVTGVNWLAAIRFCNKLSEMMGYRPAYNETTMSCDLNAEGFRLPTEAEWEYACRAGTTTKYYNGNTEADAALAAWYSGNSGGVAHSVKQKVPNAWGLYDMLGNVEEWCNDWYGLYCDEERVNPYGPQNGIERVVRGGSYLSTADEVSVYARAKASPDVKNTNYRGFRIVRRP